MDRYTKVIMWFESHFISLGRSSNNIRVFIAYNNYLLINFFLFIFPFSRQNLHTTPPSMKPLFSDSQYNTSLPPRPVSADKSRVSRPPHPQTIPKKSQIVTNGILDNRLEERRNSENSSRNRLNESSRRTPDNQRTDWRRLPNNNVGEDRSRRGTRPQPSPRSSRNHLNVSEFDDNV